MRVVCVYVVCVVVRCSSASTTRFVMAESLALVGTSALGEEWPRMRQLFDRHCGSMVSRLCDGGDGCVLFHRIQLLQSAELPSEHYKLVFDSDIGVIDL